jgi:hypothetical protein
MPLPADPIAHVKALHAAYQARTGYTIIYNPNRERQWSEWCRYADWSWTEKEMAIVISYLRGKIAKSERNEGALKFENLIGSPDRFEEDLNLANEARKGSPTFRPKQRPQEAPKGASLTNSFGEEIHVGKNAALNFANLCKQDL